MGQAGHQNCQNTCASAFICKRFSMHDVPGTDKCVVYYVFHLFLCQKSTNRVGNAYKPFVIELAVGLAENLCTPEEGH